MNNNDTKLADHTNIPSNDRFFYGSIIDGELIIMEDELQWVGRDIQHKTERML